jgi:hypothetical protein
MPIRCSFAVFLLAVSVLAVHAADDPYGDPLPAGAKTRLGTIRYRYSGTYPPVVSPDGKTIYIHDGWGARRLNIDGTEQAPLPNNSSMAMPFGFSADGSRAISTYSSTQVWDVATGKELAKLKRTVHFFDRGLPLAELSADGKVLVLGAVKRDTKEPVDVLVWDVDGNKEIVRFVPAHNEQALVALAPDGKMVATWGKASAPGGKTDPEERPGTRSSLP